METNICGSITFIFCLLIYLVSGFLDFEELKSISYGIDILNKPVLMSIQDADTSSSTIDVTSKHGQVYRCKIPNQIQADKQKEEEEKLAMETGVPELLKTMESGPCLFKTRDWWSYELCYGKHVRQFHMEDGKISGNVIMLGYYESDFDWNNQTNMRLALECHITCDDYKLGENKIRQAKTIEKEIKKRHKNRLNRYHSQQYVNGSKCDLTGKSRKTEVRFLCEEGVGDYIARLDEPETCSYVLTVHTTKICHHPYLKLPTAQKPVPITCNPAVSDDIFQEYIKEEEEKRILQEKIKEEERIEKELRDAEPLFNTVDKLREPPRGVHAKPVSVKHSGNTRTMEYKDVSHMDSNVISKVEKLLSEGLKDDMEKLSDDFEGQDVDVNMKVKVVKSMDDLQDFIKQAEKDAVELLKKRKQKLTEKSDFKSSENTEELSDAEEKQRTEAEEEGKRYDSKGEGLVSDKQDETDTDLKFQKSPYSKKIEDTVRDIDRELDQVDTNVAKSFKGVQKEKLKQYKEEFLKNRKSLAAIKKSISETMENEFDSIIEEAEEETGIQLQNRRETHKQLSNTLNKLLERLDKTERDIANVDKEIDRLTEDVKEMKAEETDEEARGPSRNLEKSSLTKSSSESAETESIESPETDKPTDRTPQSKQDRVKIRVSKLNAGDVKTDSMKSTTQTKQLEQEVQDSLEKAGLDLGNGKIQVKIITAGYVDENDESVHLLSPEDTSAFKNMIVSILGGDHEAEKEEIRQKEMEESYNYVWGKGKKKSQTIST